MNRCLTNLSAIKMRAERVISVARLFCPQPGIFQLCRSQETVLAFSYNIHVAISFIALNG